MSIRRVYIHAGPPKTGTTSIQAFMSGAEARLRAQGVRYTTAGRIREGQSVRVRRPSGWTLMRGPNFAQHLLPWSLLGEVENLSGEDCWRALVDELQSADESVAVISSEAFSRMDRPGIEAIRNYLEDYEVRVICYLRAPMDKLLSDYAQRIRAGMYHDEFSAYLAEYIGLAENYDDFVSLWDQVFGAGNVLVRDFDAAIAAGVPLELDFAACFLSDPASLAPALGSKLYNASPSVRTLKRMRLVNRIESTLGRPESTRRLFAGMRRVAAARILDVFALPFGPDPLLFTPEDEERIAALSASNYRALARRASLQAVPPGDLQVQCVSP